jgi:HTH-type transcriptional regulator / antitoxin HipB
MSSTVDLIAPMRIRTPTDVGLIIRERRRKLGLDQRGLAEKVGVSRQWIIAVEKGKPRAEVGLLLKTLDALGLGLDIEKTSTKARTTGLPAVDINAVIDQARHGKS